MFSSACSRCFFLTRKRAEAAVLRRRLSSSAAWREAGVSGASGAEGVELESAEVGEERARCWLG